MKGKRDMKKAHVEVFGHDVEEDGERKDSWHWKHHHRHEAPVLGVMVLLAGIMLFLNVIGQVPWAVWDEIWKFWPVILIFIGIQILSEFILFFLALFVFGIIAIYAMQQVGAPFIAHWAAPDWIAFWLTNIRRIMP